MTLLNIAHALAHQITAIECDLALPNILLVDGVSSNLRTTGLDRERLDAVYDYVQELGDEYGDRLQIIVADNSVPQRAVDSVRVQLSEQDKLIPTRPLR